MRLLHYTLSRLTIILFCILSVWAFIFYRFMIDEINDETDNMLSNYKEHILRKFLIQGDDNSMQEQIMGSYKITPIPKDIAKEYSETYIDTVIYVDIESEYEPARALKTTFMGPDEQHYELIVLSSVLEKEDLIENRQPPVETTKKFWQPWFCLTTGWCKRTVANLIITQLFRLVNRSSKTNHRTEKFLFLCGEHLFLFQITSFYSLSVSSIK